MSSKEPPRTDAPIRKVKVAVAKALIATNKLNIEARLDVVVDKLLQKELKHEAA